MELSTYMWAVNISGIINTIIFLCSCSLWIANQPLFIFCRFCCWMEFNQETKRITITETELNVRLY